MSFSASTRFSFRVALARLRHSSKWKNSPVLPPSSPLLSVMRFVRHRDRNHPLSCSRMLLLLSYWNFPTLFCLGVIFKVLLRLLFALFVMATLYILICLPRWSEATFCAPIANWVPRDFVFVHFIIGELQLRRPDGEFLRSRSARVSPGAFADKISTHNNESP